MQFLRYFNLFISIAFLLCYSYQFIYIPISLLAKPKKFPKCEMTKKYAVLICARNEQDVLPDLLECINTQTYPRSLINVFVMADNCTDMTAKVALEHGAVVYERFNKEKIGKGYALDTLLRNIKKDYPDGFDGYMVFDADNILCPDYIEQVNRCHNAGNKIVTGYRNSKNYGDNWISAGYATWFLRESRFLSGARTAIGTSCAVSGTGFMFDRAIADKYDGWPFHLLTEDIEFSIDSITSGEKIEYCPNAELYDEQPTKFSQAWHQRMRWSRGYLQVIFKYGAKMISGIFKGSFSCYDMSMIIMPAYILSALSIITNISVGIVGAIAGDNLLIAVDSVFKTIVGLYFTLFIIGAITVISEWKHIYAGTVKKIWSIFTFPVYMATYIPIAICALFCKIEWKHIQHTRTKKQLSLSGVVIK